MPYDLWYWPGLPGRGEFVRLTLEAAGLPYRDRGVEGGAEALLANMEKGDRRPFAPPYLPNSSRRCANASYSELDSGA